MFLYHLCFCFSYFCLFQFPFARLLSSLTNAHKTSLIKFLRNFFRPQLRASVPSILVACFLLQWSYARRAAVLANHAPRVCIKVASHHYVTLCEPFPSLEISDFQHLTAETSHQRKHFDAYHTLRVCLLSR